MRKLSFNEKLRHRLRDTTSWRRRQKRVSSEGMVFLAIGAVAGVAAGVLIAQRYGGIGAITTRMRERFSGWTEEEGGPYDGDAYHDEHEIELSPMEELEERVLDAYHNDPLLSERAIDIGAIGSGIIELTGWVHSAAEATHAVTVARGTPGVRTVVNRIVVRDDEEEYDSRAQQFEAGDESLTEAQWDGGIVGMRRPPGAVPLDEDIASEGDEDLEAPRGD